MAHKIFVYNDTGEYLGYARLGTDEIGQPVAEIYNLQADRLGAIQYREMNISPMEGLVYNQEGDQIGYVLVEQGVEGRVEAEVYRLDHAGEDKEHVAHVHLPANREGAEVYMDPPWGDKAGSLKSDSVSDEELAVAGGGAAILLLL